MSGLGRTTYVLVLLPAIEDILAFALIITDYPQLRLPILYYRLIDVEIKRISLLVIVFFAFQKMTANDNGIICSDYSK